MQNAIHNSTKPSSSLPERRPRQQQRGPRRKHRGLRREISAGGVIFRQRDGHLEFFFIRDPFGKWTFPKGHQELGETLAETAIREIREETGLTGLRYVAPLGRTSFRFRREKTVIEKTVFLFLFEAPLSAKEQLTGEEAIQELRWFPADRSMAVSGYRNLDRLFARAMRLAAEDVMRQKPSRAL